MPDVSIPLLLLLGALVAAAVVALVVGSKPSPRPLELLLPGTIVYAEAGDIMLARPDGTRVGSLTTGPFEDDRPVWSKDGQRIAFTRGELDPTANPNGSSRLRAVGVWVMNADGSGATEVLGGTRRFSALSYAFSPDGRRLAISVQGGGLHVVDVTTRTAERIAGPDLERTELTWSPDGSLLAFEGTVNLADERIDTRVWVIGADGTGQAPVSGQVELPPRTSYEPGVPQWSPTGSTLLYQAPARGDANNPDIIVAHRESAGWRETRPFSHVPGLEVFPSYSHDGTRIAFMRSPELGLSQDLWVAQSDGSNMRRVAINMSLPQTTLCWSPDDRQIAAVVQTGSDDAQTTRLFDVAGARAPLDLPEAVASAGCGFWSPLVGGM